MSQSHIRQISIFFHSQGDDLEVAITPEGQLLHGHTFSELNIEIERPECFMIGQLLNSMSGEKIDVFHIEKSFVSNSSLHFFPIMKITEGQEILLGQGQFLCQALGFFWAGFEGRKTHIPLPKLFSKNVQKKDYPLITFFGGSFYPWHEGHGECLKLCPETDIIVVPDSNPWKGHEKNSSQRYWERLKEILYILKETPYGVFPGFWGIEQGNPTVNWFPGFEAEKKNLLMGADTFLGLLDWTRVEELLETVHKIYVVPRLISFEEIDIKAKQIKNSYPEIQVLTLSSHPYEHISSTLIRESRN